MSGPPSLPPGPAAQGLPVRGSDLLLILIISLLAVRLLGGVIADLLAPAQGETPQAGRLLVATLALLLVQTLILLAAIRALVIRKYGLSWADLGLRPTDRRWYGRAVAVAVLLLPAVALVNSLIPDLFDLPFENPQLYAIAPAGFTWFGLLAMTVMAGVVAPFGEELAFRGLLFGWLRERLGTPGAVALSGFGFALMHGVPLLIPALTVIGMVLAVLYQRSGSLWPPILAHGLFNALMVFALYSALAAGVEPP